MSELNVYHHELRPDEYDEFYLKYEADKVIALLKDKANYNEYAYKHKSEEFADTCRFYEKELRHHKYKRCLAMARWCDAELEKLDYKASVEYTNKDIWRIATSYFTIWHKRWLKLAEKLK